MHTLFRTRGEVVLMTSGAVLFMIILGVYGWGIARLGGAFRSSVGGEQAAVPKVEFQVKEASDLLRARGLLE